MQQEGPRIHTFEDSLSVRACFSMTTEDTAILVGRRTYSSEASGAAVVARWHFFSEQ